jgi:hypothetical protein
MPRPVKQVTGHARFDAAKLWQAVDGERLRRGREGRVSHEPFRQGYTLARVAREAGLDAETLHGLRAVAHPTLDTVARLLLWLGDCNIRAYLVYDGTAGDDA